MLQRLVDDLSKMIGTLHHRSRSLPGQWAHFDQAQLEPAWKQGIIKENISHECISSCGSDYGSWKKFSYAEVHRGDSFTAHMGLLTFELQQRLFTFLREFMDTISDQTSLVDCRLSVGSVAQGSSDSMATDKEWTNSLAIDPQDQSKFSSGAGLVAQPFGRPPRFDINALISSAETNLEEASRRALAPPD